MSKDKTLTKKKLVQFFIIIFSHITVLDLFILSGRGPVFLWQKNLTILTVSVHLGIVLFSCLLLSLLSRRFNKAAK